MNTTTDSNLQMTSALAVSPMSASPMCVSPSFTAFVPVSYASAAVVPEADMGADAAAHVVGGWVSPCTLTVVKKRTDVVLATAICTQSRAYAATAALAATTFRLPNRTSNASASKASSANVRK